MQAVYLGVTLHRGLRSLASYTTDWDLLDESKDVVQMWQQLPSVAEVPFALILRADHRRRLGQLARALNGLQNLLPLQDFEWQHFLDRQRRLVREADLRLRVYHSGIHPSMRATVWRHLLYVFPPLMSLDERQQFLEEQRAEYQRLRSSWQSAERTAKMEALKAAIRNDVARTDRGLEFFHGEENPHLDALFNILVTFAVNCPEISYLQGLNDIAGIFLMVYGGAEADAYIVFHNFVRLTRSLFTPEGLALKFAHLKALLHRFDAAFYDYLTQCNSHELLFCYRWLLLEMKREFAFGDSMRVMEVMWSTLPPPPEYTRQLQESLASGVLAARGESFSMREVLPQVVEKDIRLPTKNGQQSGFVQSIDMEIAEKDVAGGSWTVIDCLLPTAPEHSSMVATTPLAAQLAEDCQAAIRSPSLPSSPHPETVSMSREAEVTNSEVAPVDCERKLDGSEARSFLSPQKKSESSSARKEAAFSPPSEQSSWDVVSVDEPCLRTEQRNGDQLQVGAEETEASLAASYDECTTWRSSQVPTASAQPMPSRRRQQLSRPHSLPVSSPGSHDGFPYTQSPNATEASTNDSEDSENVQDAIQATYGSPFVLFVCLALLLLHRDHIMQRQLQEEDIAIYFDQLRGRHKVSRVLDKARSLLDEFVRTELQSPVSE